MRTEKTIPLKKNKMKRHLYTDTRPPRPARRHTAFPPSKSALYLALTPPQVPLSRTHTPPHPMRMSRRNGTPLLKPMPIALILLRNNRPLIHAIQNGHGHALRQMQLDVTMEEPGARVRDLVAQHDPRLALIAGDERVAVIRVREVEAGGFGFDGLGDGGVAPETRAGADLPRLGGVLVHEGEELDGLRGQRADLQDKVHPGAVEGADHERRVQGVGDVGVV